MQAPHAVNSSNASSGFRFLASGLLLCACLASAQQAAPATALLTREKPSAPETVYPLGPGVVAPELLSSGLAATATEKCEKPLDGKVLLWLVVDSSGSPHGISVLPPLSKDLDKLAILVVEKDHFKPGSHDGQAVPVRISLEVGMQGCVRKARDEKGKKVNVLELRSEPVQRLGALLQPPSEFWPASGANPNRGDQPVVYRIGSGVSAPVPIFVPSAHFTPLAEQQRTQGVCLIALIVDAQGLPRNARVIRSLDPGLDQNALDAVMKYRFKPAMKAGVPVPVMITLEVNFRLR